MRIFSVGSPCPFSIIPTPVPNYTVLEGGDIFFAIRQDNIPQLAADNFQEGRWWFSIRKEQDHLVFLGKNRGVGPNSMIAIHEFQFSLNKVDRRHWEKFLSLQVGQAYMVHFLLIERRTNIIKAMRLFGLSRNANQYMKAAFEEQVKQAPKVFNAGTLPSSLRKSFDMGIIKESAGTK